ncbi:hypothetical protein N7509_011100 [Penicillium cosmopolitanum]|uniref:Uncharacterized protein n=1 Tax=Penicillium cosmopolitanum TaxID=1131564 RepID=A0A9W9VSV4_9EURO|nr:uncharacterized protein N7509_011100 [Penicillium cosmopolitanum]KAJ5388559.1 hypothetical protein N7509_011100 [Penicillium cosmopolitanum]
MNTRSKPRSLPEDAHGILNPEIDQLDAFYLELGDEDNHRFLSIQNFRKIISARKTALKNNEKCQQFLVVTEVKLSDFETLSLEPESKHRRLYYSVPTETLAVKVMPLDSHEIAIKEFDKLVARQVDGLHLDSEVLNPGSGTKIMGNFRKEADSSWAHISDHLRPKIILEVGLSQSQRQLNLISRGWLQSSDSSVEVVITIGIDRNIPNIQIDRWELTLNPDYGRTRFSPPRIASRTESFQISRNNDTTSSAPDLSIDFRKLTGHLQGPEANLTISGADLETLAERVWLYQGIL